MDIDGYSAEEVASKAMNIAGEMCIYTNKNFMTEVLDSIDQPDEETKGESVDGEDKGDTDKKEDEKKDWIQI